MRSKAYIFAAFLLAASFAQASPPALDKAIPAYGAAERAKATPIAITGPATLDVGQEGLYRLSGTPAVDLSKPLLDQLAWALGEGRMYVYLLAPGQPAAPLEVRLELVIAAGGATLQPVIHVTPLVAGEHRVVIDWNYQQDQLAEFRIAVGGGPEPVPPDPIPPEPNPTDKWQVMIFHESDNLDNMTLAQRELTSGLVFRKALEAKGHRFLGALDYNALAKATKKCPDGSCASPELQSWWKVIEGKSMPCLAIAPLNGGDIRVFPLPANSASLFALLEGQK